MNKNNTCEQCKWVELYFKNNRNTYRAYCHFNTPDHNGRWPSITIESFCSKFEKTNNPRIMQDDK
jgi:hypothetical protein